MQREVSGGHNCISCTSADADGPPFLRTGDGGGDNDAGRETSRLSLCGLSFATCAERKSRVLLNWLPKSWRCVLSLLTADE